MKKEIKVSDIAEVSINTYRKIIYISGRITGNKNWKKQFQQAEDYLISKGYYKDLIINPLGLDKITELNCKRLNKVPTYKDYMITDIDCLNWCDTIYMLRGWWRSKGARLEHHIARVLGMKIIYQKRGDK